MKTSLSRRSKIVLGVCIFTLLLVGTTVAIRHATRNNTLGIDFLIYWFAGRATFLENVSPYSDDIGLQSQMAILDRPALPEEDQLMYVYPPYALLGLLPTYWMSFDWAQALVMAIYLLAFPSAFLFFGPGIRKWIPISALGFYPVVFGLITGNMVIMISIIMTFLVAVLFRNTQISPKCQFICGFFLGWITYKPQFTWLIIIFLIVLSFRKRYVWVIYGFIISMVFYITVSFIIVPDWPEQLISRMVNYSIYNRTWPTLTLFLFDIFQIQTAMIISAILGMVLAAVTVWFLIIWWRKSISDLALFAWCGIMTILIHPRGFSYEHLAFLIPMAVWAATKRQIPSWSLILFWVGSIFASWVVFLVARQPIHPGSISDWPVLLGLLWTLWLIVQELKKSKPGSNSLVSLP